MLYLESVTKGISFGFGFKQRLQILERVLTQYRKDGSALGMSIMNEIIFNFALVLKEEGTRLHRQFQSHKNEFWIKRRGKQDGKMQENVEAALKKEGFPVSGNLGEDFKAARGTSIQEEVGKLNLHSLIEAVDEKINEKYGEKIAQLEEEYLGLQEYYELKNCELKGKYETKLKLLVKCVGEMVTKGGKTAERKGEEDGKSASEGSDGEGGEDGKKERKQRKAERKERRKAVQNLYGRVQVIKAKVDAQNKKIDLGLRKEMEKRSREAEAILKTLEQKHKKWYTFRENRFSFETVASVFLSWFFHVTL